MVDKAVNESYTSLIACSLISLEQLVLEPGRCGLESHQATWQGVRNWLRVPDALGNMEVQILPLPPESSQSGAFLLTSNQILVLLQMDFL